MSEEDFLSRWSRRKREAEESVKAAVPPQAKDVVSSTEVSTALETSNAPDAGKNPEKKPEEQFDLSTLPSIDSITAATDVTAFLRKGVPLELTRAALRRAWAADPAIRDFVGLAENAWDFNDPNAMPGFGPLDHTPEQVRELVAKIVGDVRRAVDDVAPATAQSPPAPDSATDSNISTGRMSARPAQPEADETAAAAESDAGASAPEPASESPNRDAASQNNQGDSVKLTRSHGGALPR